jgi:hypothetical protein
MDATTALAIYRAEKDKALRERRVSHVQLMAEAQEAFRKMLADAQLARKGGRPKGSTNAASAASATPSPVPVVQTPAVPPAKLVLRATKATPVKGSEKVSPSGSTPAKVGTLAKAAVAHSRPPHKSEKRVTEKRHQAAKSRPVAKAAKRAAAPAARKGSAKKATVPRKQAAARERNAKARKR